MAPTFPPLRSDSSAPAWTAAGVPEPDPGALDLGEPHVSMLRKALELMAPRPQSAEAPAEMLGRLDETRRSLERWIELVDAAEASLLETAPEAPADAAPQEGPAPLEALAAEWVAAQDRFETEYGRLHAAELAAQAEYPPLPDEIRDPRNPSVPRDVAELRRMDVAWRASAGGAGEGAPHQDAYRGWLERCARVDARFGVRRLEERMDTAARASDSLARAVIGRRPETLGEAAAKYGVMLKYFGDGHGGIDDPAPFRAFLEDLEQLAAEAKRCS